MESCYVYHVQMKWQNEGFGVLMSVNAAVFDLQFLVYENAFKKDESTIALFT